jgi:8-oxo-dGTP pyrophosphatase MutT (NUDIX family)
MTPLPLPRITDPERIPVIATDDRLPPVPAERLRAPALRERFRTPTNWAPEVPGDGGRFNPGVAPAPAAVLMPLVQRDAGLQVLLTRRTEHLRDHGGQIAFPGGRSEADDADAVATALRETEEEVGLERRHVEVIGALPHYTTVTGYLVTPVVALVEPTFTLDPYREEVDEVFEVPLGFLMTPAHHRRHEFDFAGHRRQFLSMPWQTIDAQGGERRYFIWGATAAMLRNLYRFLSL